jgi:DNA (cytosine-5)-methyltransferase 1
MPARVPPVYAAVSLFSGAGGMDAGLERTGRFVTVACAEKEPAFCDTLEANRAAGRFGRADTKIIRGPIEDVDADALMASCGLAAGQLDVLIAGPPCQTFSTAGKRGTISDPRGLLLWDFLRFVAAFRPKYFLMENVRGLLSAAVKHRKLADRPERGGPPLEADETPGSVVERWLSDLEAMTDGEYRVDCFEVNAANYGAPQIRERVLFFGNRLDQVIDFPTPTHGSPHRAPKATLDSAEPLVPFRTLGDALETVVEDDRILLDFSPRKKAYLELVPEGSNWRALPEGVQRESMGKAWHAKGGRSGWWRRLSRDLTCPTIVTMPNHASTSMCHPTETRALTLRECAAVQEFPPDWTFCGSTSKKYAQVGNALPLRLAEVAGMVLAGRLDRGGRPDREAEAVGKYRRVYLKSHVRTRQWFKGGTVYAWRDGEDNSHAHYSGATAAVPA